MTRTIWIGVMTPVRSIQLHCEFIDLVPHAAPPSPSAPSPGGCPPVLKPTSLADAAGRCTTPEETTNHSDVVSLAAPPSPSAPSPGNSPSVSKPTSLADIANSRAAPEETTTTCPAPSPARAAPQASSRLAPREASRGATAVTTTPAVTLSATTTANPGPQQSNEGILESVAHTRTRRIRKAQVLHLNACDCGVTITDDEIQQGDNLMKCRVAGCETVWVSPFSVFSVSDPSRVL